MDKLFEEVEKWLSTPQKEESVYALMKRLYQRARYNEQELKMHLRNRAEIAHSGGEAVVNTQYPDTEACQEVRKQSMKQFYCPKHGAVEEIIESCIPGSGDKWCERCRLDSFAILGISRVRELK